MTQIDPSQHAIHTLEELQAAEGAHILIAGEDGQGTITKNAKEHAMWSHILAFIISFIGLLLHCLKTLLKIAII